MPLLVYDARCDRADRSDETFCRKNMGSKESWARVIGGALIVACSAQEPWLLATPNSLLPVPERRWSEGPDEGRDGTVPSRSSRPRVVRSLTQIDLTLLGLVLAISGVLTALTGLFGFCPACAMAGRKSLEDPR